MHGRFSIIGWPRARAATPKVYAYAHLFFILAKVPTTLLKTSFSRCTADRQNIVFYKSWPGLKKSRSFHEFLRNLKHHRFYELLKRQHLAAYACATDKKFKPGC